MKEWWEKKNDKTRKRKRRHNNEHYTWVDVIVDILIWIPELIILPIRVLFLLVRGFGRAIGDFFDFI